MTPNTETIQFALQDYLSQIEMTRSQRTLRTYRTGINRFIAFLDLAGFDLERDTVSQLNEQTAADFATALLEEDLSPASLNLYLTSLNGFYAYLALELNQPLDLNRVKRLLKARTPRVKRRLPQFSWEDLEAVVRYSEDMQPEPGLKPRELLRLRRDQAIILTLADTGLRVHEACALRRGDLDISRQVALITGKGAKDALIRFSTRAMAAIQTYLALRSPQDIRMAKQRSALPVFARHDRAAGSKVLPMTTFSMEKIVSELAWQALADEEKAARVTPHAFRHYFVTRVVKATSNIKAAQELARHESIATTEIYTHLLDQDLDAFYADAIENTGETLL